MKAVKCFFEQNPKSYIGEAARVLALSYCPMRQFETF